MNDEKLAIILTPNSEKELKDKIVEIDKALPNTQYQVVAVLTDVSPMNADWMLASPDLTYIVVDEDLEKVKKKCIARYLVSNWITYLLFLGMEEKITEEDLNKRIGFIEAEPHLIGVVGDKYEITDDFIEKKVFHKVIKERTLDKETFDTRCRDAEGNLRTVNPDTLLTTVKMWDIMGGFTVNSEDPYLEYCMLVQAVGYTILPLTK